MTTRQKAKGSAFEREIVHWLRDNGFPYAERGVAGATDDIGDIIGTPNLVWECKNQKAMNLSQWVNELEEEIRNQENRYVTASGLHVTGAVIHKRRGTTSPGEYYATTTLSRWTRLVKEANY